MKLGGTQPFQRYASGISPLNQNRSRLTHVDLVCSKTVDLVVDTWVVFPMRRFWCAPSSSSCCLTMLRGSNVSHVRTVAVCVLIATVVCVSVYVMDASKATGKEFAKHEVSAAQAMRFTVMRLSLYEGVGRGFACYAYIGLSMLGIVGMFAAIVGALIAPCLVDVVDEEYDEEGFRFWAGDLDESCEGAEREKLYAMLAWIDVP